MKRQGAMMKVTLRPLPDGTTRAELRAVHRRLGRLRSTPAKAI